MFDMKLAPFKLETIYNLNDFNNLEKRTQIVILIMFEIKYILNLSLTTQNKKEQKKIEKYLMKRYNEHWDDIKIIEYRMQLLKNIN